MRIEVFICREFMKKVLFLCSQNRLRSPTAEQVFATWPNIEVESAGMNHDADTPVTAQVVEWADIIFVMERSHRNKLQKRFRGHIRGRVICLNVPDDYAYMDPALVSLFRRLVPKYLP